MSRIAHSVNIELIRQTSRTQASTSPTTYSLQQLILVIIFLGLVLLSAFVLVYIKDLNRRLFIQYQALQQVEQQAKIETGQLLLERSTLSAQERIQVLAHKFNMVMPSRKHIIVISDRTLQE